MMTLIISYNLYLSEDAFSSSLFEAAVCSPYFVLGFSLAVAQKAEQVIY